MRYRLYKAKGPLAHRLERPWILTRLDMKVILRYRTGAEALASIARARRVH